MEQALQDLWGAVNGQIVYNPDAGIVKYWKQHWKELGSPVGPERPDPDGNIYQAFTKGIVAWTPAGAQPV